MNLNGIKSIVQGALKKSENITNKEMYLILFQNTFFRLYALIILFRLYFKADGEVFCENCLYDVNMYITEIM